MNKENDLHLGDCYHSGLAYALGYHANDELELDAKLFTNLDTGLDGNAMAALLDHRRHFDPSRDVERFIVALKPVKIIMNEEDDTCDDCCERLDDCYCYVSSPLKTRTDSKEDNQKEPFHTCEDEFCEEFVVDTFEPMNAFARARWLKAKKKNL